jgi:hypothetical protein
VSNLAPDLVVIRAHLDALFYRCTAEYPGGLCEIAWSEPGKFAVVNAQSFPTTPEGLGEAAALSAGLNAAGSNVYVGVNPRKPGSPDRGRCSAEHVEISFFQFCECDKPESLDLLRHSPLPYSIYVITGRTPGVRVHGYHALAIPTRDMPLWRRRQEAERDYCRGDNVIDPPRIMRLAGTINYPAPHKAARGYKAELVELHFTRAEPISDVDFDFGGFGGNGKEESWSNGEDKSDKADHPNFEADDKIAEYFAKIDTDDNWHDNARDLIAKLVSEGYSRHVIMRMAPGLTRPGYTVAQTIDDIEELIRGAEKKYSTGGGESAAEDIDFNAPPPEAPLLEIHSAGKIVASMLPPREWLLGHTLCKGFLTALIGAGGWGKTALMIAQLLSLASGRALTGERVFRRCRVLLICLEDGKVELERRIGAAMKHYRIDPTEVDGWLFYAAPLGMKLARMRKGGIIVPSDLAAQLRRLLVVHDIEAVGFDPFIKTHDAPENDNSAIDQVCDILTTIAVEMNVAPYLAHHDSKGVKQPGDTDRGRGASSLPFAARINHTITPMTIDEQELFNVDNRKSFVRVDSQKVNLCPSSQARWYQLVGVELGNITDTYPLGDEIQVAEPWCPPDLFFGLSHALLNAMLDEIDRGLPDGDRYSNENAARNGAAWKVIQQYAPQKTEEQCKEIIKEWVAKGVLYVADYINTQRRETVKGLHVNGAKRPN